MTVYNDPSLFGRYASLRRERDRAGVQPIEDYAPPSYEGGYQCARYIPERDDPNYFQPQFPEFNDLVDPCADRPDPRERARDWWKSLDPEGRRANEGFMGRVPDLVDPVPGRDVGGALPIDEFAPPCYNNLPIKSQFDGIQDLVGRKGGGDYRDQYPCLNLPDELPQFAQCMMAHQPGSPGAIAKAKRYQDQQNRWLEEQGYDTLPDSPFGGAGEAVPGQGELPIQQDGYQTIKMQPPENQCYIGGTPGFYDEKLPDMVEYQCMQYKPRRELPSLIRPPKYGETRPGGPSGPVVPGAELPSFMRPPGFDDQFTPIKPRPEDGAYPGCPDRGELPRRAGKRPKLPPWLDRAGRGRLPGMRPQPIKPQPPEYDAYPMPIVHPDPPAANPPGMRPQPIKRPLPGNGKWAGQPWGPLRKQRQVPGSFRPPSPSKDPIERSHYDFLRKERQVPPSVRGITEARNLKQPQVPPSMFPSISQAVTRPKPEEEEEELQGGMQMDNSKNKQSGSPAGVA